MTTVIITHDLSTYDSHPAALISSFPQFIMIIQYLTRITKVTLKLYQIQFKLHEEEKQVTLDYNLPVVHHQCTNAQQSLLMPIHLNLRTELNDAVRPYSNLDQTELNSQSITILFLWPDNGCLNLRSTY